MGVGEKCLPQEDKLVGSTLQVAKLYTKGTKKLGGGKKKKRELWGD